MSRVKAFGISVIGAVFMTGAAHAQCTAVSCNAKVDRLLAYGNGDIFLMMDVPQAELDKLDCQPGPNNSIEIPKPPAYEEVARDRIYSALLSARLSDLNVTVRMVNGSGACEILYVDSQ